MNKRMNNIDLLKIVCIIAVILLHVTTNIFYKLDKHNLNNINLYIMTFYSMITRFCVPCFIMITGMFILDKDISIKTIFQKYIFRIILIYSIFSLLYALYVSQTENLNFILILLEGYYQLWYLYLLAGLYLITPILKKITNDNQITKYFLVLSLIFSSIIPFVMNFINIPGLKEAIKNLNVHLVLGYTGYYLAGYYLSKIKVNNKLFYILGILGFILNYIFFIMQYNKINIFESVIYEDIFLLPGTVFQSIAVFLLFKNFKIKNSNLLTSISNKTFSIYLIHILIMKILFSHIDYQSPLIYIPLVSLMIYIICLIISVALKKLPFLKHYL